MTGAEAPFSVVLQEFMPEVGWTHFSAGRKHEIITSNGNVRNKMSIEVENGKNDIIWQELIPGFPPKYKLHLVDEVTGKKGVTESALIHNKDWFKP
jgi:hypothetical protein